MQGHFASYGKNGKTQSNNDISTEQSPSKANATRLKTDASPPNAASAQFKAEATAAQRTAEAKKIRVYVQDADTRKTSLAFRQDTEAWLAWMTAPGRDIEETLHTWSLAMWWGYAQEKGGKADNILKNDCESKLSGSLRKTYEDKDFSGYDINEENDVRDRSVGINRAAYTSIYGNKGDATEKK